MDVNKKRSFLPTLPSAREFSSCSGQVMDMACLEGGVGSPRDAEFVQLLARSLRNNWGTPFPTFSHVGVSEHGGTPNSWMVYRCL